MRQRVLVLALLGWGLLPAAAHAAGPDFTAELVARTFFRGLLEGRPGTVLPLCGSEVNLDGRRLRDRAELQQALEALSARARQRGLRLRLLVLLDAREAVRRRIRGSFGPDRLVALARFSQLGAVALLRREDGFWRVTALTD